MTKNKKVKRRISSTILTLTIYVIAAIIIVSLFLSLSNGNSANLFGYTVRIVVTGSMEPNIKTNSLNVIKLTNIEDIQVNDIVCFNYSQDIVHRVIEKTTNDSGETILHTKGDANSQADSIEITNDMVIGKVVKTYNNLAPFISNNIIYSGKIDIISFMRNLILKTIILGIIIIIIYKILKFIILIIKALKRKNDFKIEIHKYMREIDDLIMYKELLKDLKDSSVENKTETRFSFIFNNIAKVKAEMEIKDLQSAIKSFKKQIKYCEYLNTIGTKLDIEENKRKENKKSIKENCIEIEGKTYTIFR